MVLKNMEKESKRGGKTRKMREGKGMVDLYRESKDEKKKGEKPERDKKKKSSFLLLLQWPPEGLALPLDPPLFANPTFLWRVQLAGRPSNGLRLGRLRGLFFFSVGNLDCLLEAEQIVAEGQGVVLVNTDEAGILLVTNFCFFFLHEGTREIHSSWHYTTGND